MFYNAENKMTVFVAEIQEIDDEKSVIDVYSDKSKAFDIVNYNILLHNHKHYGMRRHVLGWSENYCTVIKPRTFVNST